jgi:hypothetical protein|tara:strand:+ start:520 stop:801 length:282 start_codon:yes stop_codon:yes gene_type:complete
MNRKQRRTAEKKEKSQSPEDKALAQKISLFGHLPDACNTCTTPFDKQNREMVFSWSVVVHQEEQKVRLFCPDCINKTKETPSVNQTNIDESTR